MSYRCCVCLRYKKSKENKERDKGKNNHRIAMTMTMRCNAVEVATKKTLTVCCMISGKNKQIS